MSRFSGHTIFATARQPKPPPTPLADASPQAEVSEEFVSFQEHGGENLQEFSSRLQRLVRLTGVAIAVDQGEDVVCVASSGPAAPPLGTVLDRSRGLSAECLQSLEIKVSNDALADSRVNRDVCRRNGIRSTVVVPLLIDGKPIGILGVFSDRPGYFTERQIFLLEFIAAFLSRLSVLAPVAPETPAEEDVSLPSEESAAATATPAFTIPEKGSGLKRVLVACVAAVAMAVMAVVLFLNRGGSFGVTQAETAASGTSAPADSASHQQQPDERVFGAGGTIATSLEHWSAPGYTRITIHLDRERSFRCERLLDPARLYCDFQNLKLPLEYAGQDFADDPLVGGVRAGQHSEDVARLVFDLKSPSSRHAVAVLSNPARLIVEIMDLPGMGVEESSADAPSIDAAPEGALGNTTATWASEFTIVIDPGHGGRDTGTVGPAGLKEKDLVLDVARRLGKMLESRLGAQVILTRTTDRFMALEARSRIANQAAASLFLSIHGNGSDYGPAEGVETYYLGEPESPKDTHIAQKENQAASRSSSLANLRLTAGGPDREKAQESRDLARDVQQSLYKAAAQNGSTRDRGVRTAPFIVLRDAAMPAILAEISFLSSKAEEHRLMQASHRQALADGLFQGIATHLARRKKTVVRAMALQ